MTTVITVRQFSFFSFCLDLPGMLDPILLFISFAYLLGNLRFFHNIFWFCSVTYLFNRSSFFIMVSFLHSFSVNSPGQSSVQVWAPAQKENITNSPDTFSHFLRLFAFHVDGQLRFTGGVLDGNTLIITVNC